MKLFTPYLVLPTHPVTPLCFVSIAPTPPRHHSVPVRAGFGGTTQLRDNLSSLRAIPSPAAVSISPLPSELETRRAHPALCQFVELLSLTLRGARPPAKSPY